MINDFIPEAEAIGIANVSVRTLQRFAEAGYLRIENNLSGVQLFSKMEVLRLFGQKDLNDRSPEPQPIKTTEIEVITMPSVLPEACATAASPPLLNVEIERLKNLLIIQEKLLDSREKEIEDLKDQRQWLRTRVENLEQRGERDQLLILSSTQSVRKLITINQEKRAPLRAALAWLGLLPAPTTISSPLAHAKAPVD